MAILPIQNSISFKAKFVISPGLKSDKPIYQNSSLIQKESQLSKELQQVTKRDPHYKLVLSSRDASDDTYIFKLLDNSKKKAKCKFEFAGKPEKLTIKDLVKVYGILKLQEAETKEKYTYHEDEYVVQYDDDEEEEY